ncbi:hypothetical protein HOLleu_43783 [Holothuria leucospilota]|uniref:Uncharacterized protein n=1 Tax=Holothuria leucospilota TaxID=206669 RepID=A0A9Q1BBD0_HOLLE|nr:hypothetical protein HOLleu_43783 [Holothuria leucospilota]
MRENSKILTNREVQDEENYLIRVAQVEAFSKDIEDVRKEKLADSNSVLKTVMPKIDEEGVLRMSGRLSLIETFPYECEISSYSSKEICRNKLIVRKYHTDANHAVDTNHILTSLNERFWVIHGREEAV